MEHIINYWPIILIMVLASIGSIVYSVIYSKKEKVRLKEFLNDNPDAGKIHLKSGMGVTQEQTTIYSVNNDKPLRFHKGTKSGVYAPVGTVNLSVNYTYTRPGVMYKSVTTSTDIIELDVEVEPNKEYLLSYNRKKQEFNFEEK